jgi:Carbohydrate-binding family 9
MMKMATPIMLVRRHSFSIEEPWALPGGCEAQPLWSAVDGAAPRLSTSVAAYHDGRVLYVWFSAADDDVVATLRGHDEPLWQEDVLEIFIAPRTVTEYFEVEVNPIGTTFDARIESPDGSRETMRAFLDWEWRGMDALVRRDWLTDGRSHLLTLLRLPFAGVGEAPVSGERWRANFLRVDRSTNRGDEYSAWSPTLRSPADFHVSAALGTLRFE